MTETSDLILVKLNHLLDEAVNCLTELSLKETEIAWEMNEISRPTCSGTGPTGENKTNSIGQTKLRDLLSNITAYQKELHFIIQRLKDAITVSQTKSIHLNQLLDETKLVKIKNCLVIIKRDRCLQFKSSKCKVPLGINCSNKLNDLTIKKPAFDHPIVNHLAAKQGFQSLANPTMASTIQVRTGDKVLTGSNHQKLRGLSSKKEITSDIQKCAIDLEERLHSGSINNHLKESTSLLEIHEEEQTTEEIKVNQVDDILEPTVIRGNKIDTNDDANYLEPEIKRFQNVCFVLENGGDSLTTNVNNDSFELNNATKLDEEEREPVDIKKELTNNPKSSKVLGETLENLNRIFDKLERMEKQFSSNQEDRAKETVNDNEEINNFYEDVFVDSEEYIIPEEFSSRDIFYSAKEYLTQLDKEESE